jgi:radical SAM superfamily enzyme YgiQ (UPF0313 family)
LHAYEMADAFRRLRAPVVMGGPHATALPEEAAEHADAVVIGEAEDTWPRLLEDAAAGRLERFCPGTSATTWRFGVTPSGGGTPALTGRTRDTLSAPGSR